MQSSPTTLRPEPTILLKLPKFSTANSLSCGTVTQQLVHGRQPASDLCWPAILAARARPYAEVVSSGAGPPVKSLESLS